MSAVDVLVVDHPLARTRLTALRDEGTEVVVCSPDVGHIAYTTRDMNVAKEGWAFLKRFHLP